MKPLIFRRRTIYAALAGLAVAGCASRTPDTSVGSATNPGVARTESFDRADARPRLEAPAARSGMVGLASWYGPDFHGRPTANGEIFDQNRLTAAHPSLPLPSLARVTRLDTGESVIVRVNDRGPYAPGRIIDLSRAAAETLNFIEAGLAEVRVEALGPADPRDRAARAMFFDPDEGPPRYTEPLAGHNAGGG